MAVVGVAVHINLIYFIIWAARIVHQHHIVCVQIFFRSANFFIETQWGVVFWSIQVFTFLVFGSPAEFLDRLTVGKAQHLVDVFHLLHFVGFQIFHAGARFALFADVDGYLTELALQVAVELTGVV